MWRPRGLGNLSENSFCITFGQQCTGMLAGCGGGQARVPLWRGRAGQWLLGEEKGGIFQMKMTDGVSERPVLVTQGRGGQVLSPGENKWDQPGNRAELKRQEKILEPVDTDAAELLASLYPLGGCLAGWGAQMWAGISQGLQKLLQEK